MHPHLPKDLGATAATRLMARTWARSSLKPSPLTRRCHDQGDLHPSRLSQGQAGQRAAPGCPTHRHAAAALAHAPNGLRAARASGTSIVNGTTAAVTSNIILRDFESEGRAAQERCCARCVTRQASEPRANVTCTITPQYRNMRYWLEDEMRRRTGPEATRRRRHQTVHHSARGGTDGSGLTELGLPTPNLFTGMQKIHGPLEWISVQDMATPLHVCLKLAQLWAAEARPAARCNRRAACRRQSRWWTGQAEAPDHRADSWRRHHDRKCSGETRSAFIHGQAAGWRGTGGQQGAASRADVRVPDSPDHCPVVYSGLAWASASRKKSRCPERCRRCPTTTRT